MPITGQRKETNDRPLWPEGVYPCKLVKAFVMRGKPTQFNKDGNIKMGFIWTFKDDEGNEFELADFVNVPKNFKYNEKSNYWKRLGEMAGITITNDNVDAVVLDLGFIESYDELVEACDSKNDQGNLEKPSVKSLSVNGQELIGCARQLVVKIWRNDEGKEGNEITSMLAIDGPKAGPKKAAPKGQAAPAQEPVLSAPPAPRRQPTSTEPLQQAAGNDY